MFHELQAKDFRAIYHLLGECRELWIEPAAWQNHLLAGVSRLVHLPVGLVTEMAGFQLGQQPRIVQATEHGWVDAECRRAFHAAMQNPSPFHCPLDVRFRRLVAQNGDLTAARADILPDHEWHDSDTFNLRFRPAQMHEVLYSAMRTRSPAHYHILAFGGPSHRPTERDRQCVELLHRELVPMIGTSLASHRDISAHGLSPRRRQILELLIEGPPEKIIADRIGLRPSTVNEYLQHLYAHFGVHTRAELMAYFARRTPRRREVPPNC